MYHLLAQRHQYRSCMRFHSSKGWELMTFRQWLDLPF